ncbi:ROK family transcriptional regulator [Pararhizobium sp.]|uniref:ROK family transcriptional regulator n=1 Tax=Pararhizobium sp. TaxID=1977563 RepID=UPI0027195322|nr:ROK family transcriptional regulator [Pararhizobium sp.]MDO9416382.1 ROK family transcriptional regulator [Pararhizobium sp.]
MSVKAGPHAEPTRTALLETGGGSNQTRVRAYNERLVLSLVRRHASLSKADIARRTGLSAQTVSVIMRSLEKDGLLIRGAVTRGRVGQPSTPMMLNPDAVYSFGLKIGRRSADLILMDFVGAIRHQVHQTYAYPTPEGILSFVTQGIGEIETRLEPGDSDKIAGLGIAAPFELWNWTEQVRAPQVEMDKWRNFDLQGEIAALLPYTVFLQNDATSACGAELVFGVGSHYPDFIYFFIGSFIGGGVVLNSTLFSGRTGTAGAVGPLPVSGKDRKPVQLLKVASIFVLEDLLRAEGIDPRPLWYSAENWIDFGPPMQTWIEELADALAQAIVSSASVIDFAAAVVDGGFPPWVRARIVTAIRREIGKLDLQGVTMPDIIEGTVGSQARAIGGASLPLFSRYLIDQNVLFKEPS